MYEMVFNLTGQNDEASQKRVDMHFNIYFIDKMKNK